MKYRDNMALQKVSKMLSIDDGYVGVSLKSKQSNYI